ncbi:FAD-dependent oxidoreductase [soil metagenome]
MTERARAVVIGGGVGGTSIALHLSEMGWNDVVLLEKGEIADGATWHSAGLVGQLRPTKGLTRMNQYSVQLYRRLTEQGYDPGWHEVGSLRLVSSDERAEELGRILSMAKAFGLPLELIGADEAHELFPLFDTDGVRCAAYDSSDGWIDPTKLARAMAAAARDQGVDIRTGTAVTGIDVDGGQVTAVHTDEGVIQTGVVVAAAGMWTPQLAAMVGVTVPIQAFEHQYVRLRPATPVAPDLPTMRDPDDLVYFRPADGDLITGGYGRDPVPFGVDGVPDDFGRQLLDPDWDHFGPLLDRSTRRVSALDGAEVVDFVNGPESFTPDGEFILGESDVRGLFVAAGFNAHGIAGAGGIGRVLAQWVVDGAPDIDAWTMDIRRVGVHERDAGFVRDRTRESLSTYYDISYPNAQPMTGRGLRVSPAYDRLRDLDAVFGTKSGWERPDYFRSNEDHVHEALRPQGLAGRYWSTAIVAEHLSTREAAGLFDQTSFAKIEVSGPGACALLQRLCANDVDTAVGRVTYTQMLNERGGIEADFTVTRLAEQRYRIVTGTAFGGHDLWWLRRHAPDDGSVHIADVTSSLACIGIQGPRSRDILAAVCDDDLSNDGFGYMRARVIVVDGVPCTALRVTYVGELGWELYAPTEFGRRLWDTLHTAGQTHGLVAAGYRAIDSLRLEGGFLAWAADITTEEHPLQAGLGFAVKLDKEPAFIGSDALRQMGERDTEPTLACLVIDDIRTVALGNEPVKLDGTAVGRVTSAGQGYSVGHGIAFAYLEPDAAEVDTVVTVEVFGEDVPARVAAMPLWDPKRERVRG